jgi:hypothetical protein
MTLMVSAFNPYNTLPVADEALDMGGVELLRAGFADKRLFVSLHRHAIDTPDRWGEVLAEITLNLATLYSADGALTEKDVIAAVAAGFRDSLRTYLASSAPEPRGAAARPKPAKTTAAKSKRPKMPTRTPVKGKTKVLAKSESKSKAKAKAPARAKAKSKSASKAIAGRKGPRG